MKRAFIIFCFSMVFWTFNSCINESLEGVSNSLGTCTQNRNYTFDVGYFGANAPMTVSPNDFTILYVPTDYSITASDCPGLPDQIGPTGTDRVKYNIQRSGNSLSITADGAASEYLNLTLTTDIINATTLEFSNPFCKTVISNTSGNLTYDNVTKTNQKITLSYKATISDIDHCNAF